MPITPEQVEDFRTAGFLRIDRVAEPAELEELRERYDALMSAPSVRHGDGRGRVLDQSWIYADTHPEFYALGYAARQREIAGQLLGSDDLRVWGQMLFKPAGQGRVTPWHQDAATWSSVDEYQAVAFWMPLQDTDIEDGCMQFIPGTHREVREHLVDPDDEYIRFVPDVDASGAVACPLPAGGCTIHHFATLHYTAPNTTSTPRRAIVNRYFAGANADSFIAGLRDNAVMR